MAEPRVALNDWVESNVWAASREAQQGELDEDLDEYEGVVEALSKLESNTKDPAGQSKVISDRASEVGSFVSSSSSPWELTHGSPATGSKFSGDEALPARLQLEPATSGTIIAGHNKALIGAEGGSSYKELDGPKSYIACVPEYEEMLGRVFTAEEALRQRVEELEQKVSMLISQDYFDRVRVPKGCFAVVLPGPGYAHKFTETVAESVQLRLESIWPLCYFSPVISKLVGIATAMFSWLPVPSPVYTYNFGPDMEDQPSTYKSRKLVM